MPRSSRHACELCRLPARVDEGDASGAAHDEGVPLADVAAGDLPVGRPPGELGDATAAREADVGDHREGERGERPAPAAEQRRDRERRDRSEQRRSERAARPRHSRCGCAREETRDSGDPGGREPGERGERRAERRDEGRGDARGQTDHGRERGGGGGEEVGDDAVGGQRGIQQDEDGLAGQLRGDRHRHDDREPPRQPARERAGERFGQQQETSSREHRERESEIAGQPGIVHEEGEHGKREHRNAAHRSPAEEREEHEPGHDRGAQHARLRGHEHDEDEQHRDGAHEPERPRQSEGAAPGEDESDDDRAIGPGHRREVAQAARLHGSVELVADRARVADRQSGQQVAAFPWQALRHGEEALTQPVRPVEDRGRPREHLRRSLREQQERPVVSRGCHGQRPPQLHPGADPEPLGRTLPEHEHRHVAAVAQELHLVGAPPGLCDLCGRRDDGDRASRSGGVCKLGGLARAFPHGDRGAAQRRGGRGEGADREPAAAVPRSRAP